jgi:hypothetical protein
MPNGKTDRRRRAQPIVAAVVQPVARRLSRIEALLIEVRYEQDVHLKRVDVLRGKVETLTEEVKVNSTDIRRISPRKNV